MNNRSYNGPLFIAAFFLSAVLVSCNTFPSRFLASAAKPSDTHGLGTYACLKEGFTAAGFDNISNRTLAMISVVAKLQSNSLTSFKPEARHKAALTNTLQTVLAYGSCDKKVFPFATEADAIQSEEWLSSRELKSVDSSRYQAIFSIDKGFVMFYNTPNNPWTSLNSQRKLSFWIRYAEGFDPFVCSTPFAEGDKGRICKSVISACGLESSACNEPGEVEVD